MGREVRRVPPNWEHPMNSVGIYRPLHNQFYEELAEQWIKNFNEFKPDDLIKYYWEFENPPEEEYCVPYKKEEATWFQVYETVSEGTPTTPPFATEEELIEHLCTHGESLLKPGYGKRAFQREVAEKFVLQDKWVPSMIMTGGFLTSGIDCVGIKP